MTLRDETAEQQRFAQVLQAAIQDSGLSLAEISGRLARQGHRVSTATLSYWKNDLRSPTRRTSRPVVEALEAVLDLPLGALSNTLADSARTQRRPLAGLTAQPGLTDALADLGTSLDWQPWPQASHTHVAIRGKDTWTSLTHMLVLRAPRADTRSLPLVLPVPRGTHAVVAGHRGCTIEELVVLDDAAGDTALLVLRADLHAPLHRGQLAAIEYRLRLRDAHGSWLATALPSHTPLVGLHATFLDTAPAQVSYAHAEALPAPGGAGAPVAAGQDVQHTVEEAPPGLHLLRW